MASALGLTSYRWGNNIKSTILLLAFPFLLLLLMGGIFYFFALFYANQPGSGGTLSPFLFASFHLAPPAGSARPLDFAEAAVIGYWPIVLGVAVVWTLIGYVFNDALIRAATGAHPVTRAEQPKLYNLLENLCISRGLKVPALYIIDDPQLNAYASGLDENSYSITVTRGILERLNDEEMEAVLGHELTHIINRDCRLLIVTIVFTGMISFAAQMIWRSLYISSYSRRERGNGGLLLLIAGVMMAVGYALALVLRFALSRKREYMADAGSVELTKDPEALISALRKIAANPDVMHVPTEVRQMFIENPPSASDFFGLFDTHPRIEDRIKVLEQLGGLPPDVPERAGHSMIPPSGG